MLGKTLASRTEPGQSSGSPTGRHAKALVFERSPFGYPPKGTALSEG
jgi:hypothetical protein